jgi:hypothetical protein
VAAERAGSAGAEASSGGRRARLAASAASTPTAAKKLISRKAGKAVKPRPATLATVVSAPSTRLGRMRRRVASDVSAAGARPRWMSRWIE